MKIAYIALKGFNIGGGIEKYTEEIGSRFVEKGHEVIVYTTKHWGTSKDGIHKGIKIKTLPSLNSKSLEKISVSFFASLHQLFLKDVDIVHFQAVGPSIFAFIPKIFTKRKIVVQSHGLEWKRAKWGGFAKTFLKANEYPLKRFADKLMVVSRVLQKYFRENYGIDSVYTPTGINKQEKRKPNLIKKYGLKGNDYILFAARLVREKGAHHLIKAYNLAKPDQKLVIAGDAPHEQKYKEELKSLAKESNGKIIFTGDVQGELLWELFSNPYLYVLPSEIEGLPISLLEAMSFGNCCLVSDIKENKEGLAGYGFTFESKNHIDMSEKIKMLVNDIDLTNRFKHDAKKHVETKHSWDYIADIIEKSYLELLGKKNE